MELITCSLNCKQTQFILIAHKFIFDAFESCRNFDILVFTDNQNIPPGCIVCAWCAKVGMKLFTLRTATGCKAFCRYFEIVSINYLEIKVNLNFITFQ